jgi:hypothetical protein
MESRVRILPHYDLTLIRVRMGDGSVVCLLARNEDHARGLLGLKV